MLSIEDNEILTHVGPGTLMGNLLRRYWMPAVLSTEVPLPDSPPVRVRLMCEDLIAFRNTDGDVGLVANACPHRGASMFFGRNEESGLRCVYHGWKFDTEGNCVDMPSEPSESNFKSKVHIRAYPTYESGGVVWTYMGPADKQPPFRDFGTESMAKENWRSNKVISYCNFAQALEGDLDSSHISYLHRNLADFSLEADDTDKPGYPSNRMSTVIRGTDRAPRLEVEDAPYGFRYAGIRTTPNGHQHIRMTVFVMPIMPMVSNLPLGAGIVMKVPIDDETCWRWNIAVHDDLPEAVGGTLRRRPAQPTRVPGVEERTQFADNDYLLDRDKQRTFSYTGISGTGEQDLAVTESMGPIYQRNREHLGTTDLAIIRMRQILVRSAKELAQGIDPPGVDPSYPYHLIRSAEKILAPGEDWRKLATTEDETYMKIAVATGR